MADDARAGTSPPSPLPHATEAEEEDDEEDSGYSLDHLSAVIRPVALTMVLAS